MMKFLVSFFSFWAFLGQPTQKRYAQITNVIKTYGTGPSYTPWMGTGITEYTKISVLTWQGFVGEVCIPRNDTGFVKHGICTITFQVSRFGGKKIMITEIKHIGH